MTAMPAGLPVWLQQFVVITLASIYIVATMDLFIERQKVTAII